MKLLLVGGAVIVLAVLAVRAVRRHRAADVSGDWLRDQQVAGLRNTYEGPAISWPINKAANESARWNARRLRRSA